MKKFFSIIRIFILASAVSVVSCVHDDEYGTPDLSGKCQDLTPTKTIAEVKTQFANNTTTITDDIVIAGYVSSTDETGNIYKTIYLQDSPTNPTQGLVVSVDAVSTYTKFPQGSKVYIKLKDLAFGKYGGVLQVGYNAVDPSTQSITFGRIPEKLIEKHLIKSCDKNVKITPKVITLDQLSSSIDPLIGALVEVDNAEFVSSLFCNIYAPEGTSVDRQIVDKTRPTGATTRVVRNSGFASFAQDKLPTGNGKFVGVLSKYNSTYQFYINRASDLEMKGNRLDGSTPPTCSFSTEGKVMKTVEEVKAYYTGSLKQITDDVYLQAQVTANDKTGNLFKYIYVQDKTGGIRVNIDMSSIYTDPRFFVGKHLLINLKGLYVGDISGELQLGGIFSGNVGRILPADIYKHLFPTTIFNEVVPTERTIPQLTKADVGKWIKIKGLEYIESDLGSQYAPSAVTNKTLKDCSGNTIILRTSNFASFAKDEIDNGKGDVYAILSIFNGTYQLWITNRLGADLDGARCDGSTPPVTLFNEEFSNGLGDWATESVKGDEVWKTSNQGTGSNYYAVMNGFATTSKENEDWLVSKAVSLTGYTSYTLSFDSDVRYTGNVLEVYATDNYTGKASTTTWTKLNATLDTNSGAFGFVNSGNIDISSFAGKNFRLAFKYTSTTTASSTWEIDNVKIKGKK